jgi:toxin YxiD
MGSGYSGLYINTYGYRISKLARIKQNKILSMEAISVIASRTGGLDLSEHPREKSLTSKQKKAIKSKISNRTVTRKEYRRYESDRRFAKRRKEGVRQFWDQEKARLKAGLKPTRNWSKSQQEEILNNMKPTYNGKSLQGHHTYSASKYPHLANRGEVIFPVTFDEHLYGWHGGNFKNSLPGKPIQYKTKYDFRRNK